MTAQPGWYEAGVPGRERWWDGAQWTPHERAAGAATLAATDALAPSAASRPDAQAPLAQAPMGWYPAPGTTEARWWDGRMWTPYKLRDGVPKPDAFAIEPAGTGITLGIVFLAIGVAQIGLSTFGGGGFSPAWLFVLAGVLWLIGGLHGSRIAKLPAPRTAPLVDADLQPLPGAVEHARPVAGSGQEAVPGAGWYPVAGNATRWWTGARWSWYVAQKVGVRPAHSGPRAYAVTMVVGWVILGLSLIGLFISAVSFLDGTVFGIGIGAAALVVTLVFIALGLFLVLYTRARRHVFLLPTDPPPLR